MVGSALVELPGGLIDSGESKEQAIRRELDEEAGFICDEVKYLFSCYLTVGYSDEEVSYFDCWGRLSGEPPEPGIELVIMECDLLPQYVAGSAIRDAKTLLGLYTTKLI